MKEEVSVMGIVFETKEEARAFCDERIKPIIVVGTAGVEIAEHQGIQHETNTGGKLSIIGANEAVSANKKPVRVMTHDTEGDQGELAKKRMHTCAPQPRRLHIKYELSKVIELLLTAISDSKNQEVENGLSQAIDRLVKLEGSI